MICITPYKEIRCGDESIYDHIQNDYVVPIQVIDYLRTTQPYMMQPGVYEHPFKPGKRLLGPYLYTDGKYYWDRDTWKYVIKYHVTLPQMFIDHVMSDDGRLFLKKFHLQSGAWASTIDKWKGQRNLMCLLPNDAGDESIDNF